MRLLHLIDARSPQASPATLGLMADALVGAEAVEQHFVLLGGALLRQAGECVGLEPPLSARSPYRVTCLGVPWGSALLAWPTVARHLHDLDLRGVGSFDLIHCWSIGTLSLASLMFRATPRVLTVTTAPSARAVNWLRMWVREFPGAGTTLLAISATIRRTLLSGGVPESAVHVLRPGLDFSRVRTNDRQAMRKQWSINPEESQRVKVVALLSDPPHAADTQAAIMVAGLAGESQPPEGLKVRLLVHPGQQRRMRVQRGWRDLGRPNQLIIDDRLDQPWRVLPGCDAALALGSDAGGLSLLWAMAAGVPIIGEATYAVSEIVEDRHSALLAKPGQPAALAHRLVQLWDDSQLAWKLRDTARHEAYSFFSRERFSRSLRLIYDQILKGKPVEIPPMEITGGLRFSPRP